jgi:hypothetical protein
MPLALDDAALARVVIAATAVPPHQRGHWLARLADRIDPPSSRRAQRTSRATLPP